MLDPLLPSPIPQRTGAPALPGCRLLVGLLALPGLVLVAAALGPAPALAQVENYMLERGSNVGPATKVEPVNCVTAADGSVTCGTKLVNPEGDTPAKPNYDPFNQ